MKIYQANPTGALPYLLVAAGSPQAAVRVVERELEIEDYTEEYTPPFTIAKAFAIGRPKILNLVQEDEIPDIVLPVITVQPVGGEFAAGSTVELEVTATGDDLVYEWFHDSVEIEGADGPTLVIADFQAENEGTYSVVVSNDGSSVESVEVTLTLA